ncbi:hypothetical protein GBA52_019141 [Prunus armeniaca]|nr:hypothetical protein GBA52_019141 [Prunus armeniaca]
MYVYKVKTCQRSICYYPKNPCPFMHDGELGRRDLLRHKYSCVPCLEFKNGFCPQADACGHSLGILEERFHPMLFRTRYCWYMTTCKRQDWSYAHKEEEKSCSICAFSESLRPSKSISTALSIGVKNPVTIYPIHSMMQTLWQKQSSDYKQQQSQLQPQQQRPAISFKGDSLMLVKMINL